MSVTMVVRRSVALSLLVLFSVVAGTATASEIRVMISGGLATPYKELVPQFELSLQDHLPWPMTYPRC